MPDDPEPTDPLAAPITPASLLAEALDAVGLFSGELRAKLLAVTAQSSPKAQDSLRILLSSEQDDHPIA